MLRRTGQVPTTIRWISEGTVGLRGPAPLGGGLGRLAWELSVEIDQRKEAVEAARAQSDVQTPRPLTPGWLREPDPSYGRRTAN
ncbi:MAG: hypothetical protein ACRYG2_26745 [Janthinobacterium lividum]